LKSSSMRSQQRCRQLLRCSSSDVQQSVSELPESLPDLGDLNEATGYRFFPRPGSKWSSGMSSTLRPPSLPSAPPTCA
jgi:hypothetical protein